MSAQVLLLPDAGPLITLAYADSLDLLLKPGWEVRIVDMVWHEVTRNTTPSSQLIADWVKAKHLEIVETKVGHQYINQHTLQTYPLKKSGLGELAIQEAMNDFALAHPMDTAVFLFEDHRIMKTSFLVPENCRKVSTRAWLIFLQEKGWIPSAADVEYKAVSNGRNFSKLKFS